MLVIHVEIWPYGDRSRRRRLGTAKIANDGKSLNPFYGDYDVTILKEDSEKVVWKSGKVKGFPRIKYGIWDLLLLALGSSLGERRIKRLLKESEKGEDNGDSQAGNKHTSTGK
jgi:hypothetical protein